MAKRFTDTAKWTNNKWFFELSVELKLFWIYLLDNCDSVGVWEENIELTNIIIGYTYPLDTLLDKFKKQIYVFKDKRKWWIIDFCDFQYGNLNEDSTSKPIQSYISLLKKHSLWKEYSKGIHNLKEKDKEKEKDNLITPKQFYELEKQNAEGKYKDKYIHFVGFLHGENDMGKPLTKALELKEQVSFDNFCKLMEKIRDVNNQKGEKKVLLIDKLLSMYNTPGYLKGKINLYLTLNNWINRER